MLLTHEEIRAAASRVKLLSIDLDGTLLNNARELTPRSAAAIQGLLDRGYLVIPTTGRSLANSVGIYPELSGAQYAISTNGALITELGTGRHLARQTIPPAAAAGLIADLLDYPGSMVYLNTLTGVRTAYRSPDDIPPDRRDQRPFGTQPETAQGLCRWLREEAADTVLEVGLHFEREDGFAHYEVMAASGHPQVDFFRVGPQNLEFVRAGTSKASALKTLCRALGLTARQVCALGDNGNDVDTLAFAGLGVAMSNAIGLVRDAAGAIAPPNEEEGAAQFIETYFLT